MFKTPKRKGAIIALSMLALSTFMLTSCESKQQSGTLLGGAAGALIGSRFGKGSGQVMATGIGAVAGALVGSQIGSYMDEQDRMKMQRTTHRALEHSTSGQTSQWRNPDSGNYGTITPTNTYQTSGGQYCREYQQKVVVGGKTEEAFGRACRQPDGSWKIVS